jgi:hypothetical protein
MPKVSNKATKKETKKVTVSLGRARNGRRITSTVTVGVKPSSVFKGEAADIVSRMKRENDEHYELLKAVGESLHRLTHLELSKECIDRAYSAISLLIASVRTPSDKLKADHEKAKAKYVSYVLQCRVAKRSYERDKKALLDFEQELVSLQSEQFKLFDMRMCCYTGEALREEEEAGNLRTASSPAASSPVGKPGKKKVRFSFCE